MRRLIWEASAVRERRSGRVEPDPKVKIRSAAMPFVTRYAFTAWARRWLRRRLAEAFPRLSVWPSTSTSSSGAEASCSATASRRGAASGRNRSPPVSKSMRPPARSRSSSAWTRKGAGARVSGAGGGGDGGSTGRGSGAGGGLNLMGAGVRMLASATACRATQNHASTPRATRHAPNSRRSDVPPAEPTSCGVADF